MSPEPSPRLWWQWPTILSLDAPAIALLWQWLFGRLCGAELRTAPVIVLGASVWLSYAADRWLDAWRIGAAPLLTARHEFYRIHRRSIAVVWGVVLVANAVLAFSWLDRRELIAGGLLLVPVLIYVLSHQFAHRNQWSSLPKEILIAGLVAAGSVVFVLAHAGSLRDLIPTAGGFFLLCFANVVLIGTWERDLDARQGQTSLARRHPNWIPFLRAMAPALALSTAVVARVSHQLPLLAAACLSGSAALLGIVDYLEPHIGPEAARVLADVVLLTPLVPFLQHYAR